MTRAPADRPLRLLYVAARYLPYVGGTEIHTAEVATRMAKRGHDVTVLTTDTSRTMPRQQELDDVEVRRVPAWPRNRDYHLAPGLRKEMRSGTWDLVHVQGYHTAVAPLAMRTAAGADLPFVLTFHSGGHSSVVRQAARPVQQLLLRPLLRRASALIGVSDFETDHFRATLGLPEQRFETIPNGTSFVAEAPQEQSAPPSTERMIVCSVGRLERYKGHRRVIAALPYLLERVPDALVRLVGTGPDAARLHRQAQKLGVLHAVETTSVPAGERDRMAELLREAAVVVLLSQYESQGMAIYEALACGRPVVVSDRAALGELAARLDLPAVPPRLSPRELADTIRKVAESPSIRRPPEVADWDDITARLELLYRSVLT